MLKSVKNLEIELDTQGEGDTVAFGEGIEPKGMLGIHEKGVECIMKEEVDFFYGVSFLKFVSTEINVHKLCTLSFFGDLEPLINSLYLTHPTRHVSSIASAPFIMLKLTPNLHPIKTQNSYPFHPYLSSSWVTSPPNNLLQLCHRVPSLKSTFPTVPTFQFVFFQVLYHDGSCRTMVPSMMNPAMRW